jgi:hypothetical protein
MAERSLPTNTSPATFRGVPCRAWAGRPSEYQINAKWVIEDRLDRSLPWYYVVPICETRMCLTDDHLYAHRAERIAYPPDVCVYCGMPGYTKDHLLPVTTTGEAVRKFVAVVPACGECNNGIGNRCGHRITERREEAHRHIRKKHRKTLELAKQWPAAELAQLGPILRAHIKGSLIKRQVLMERLAWPHDPEYDKRAFQKSGFDDPIGMELL